MDAEFNPKRLLERAVMVVPTDDAARVAKDCVARILENVRARHERNVPPALRMFGRSVAEAYLEPLVDWIELYGATAPHNLSLAAVDLLLGPQCPYVHTLKRPHGSASDVRRTTLVGSCKELSGRPFVMVMTVSLDADRRVVDVDFWEWSGDPEDESDLERLRGKLIGLYLETPDALDRFVTRADESGRALMFVPSGMRHTLELDQLQAMAASHSVRLELPPTEEVAKNQIQQRGENSVGIYVEWSPFTRYPEVNRLGEFYGVRGTRPDSRVEIHNYDLEHAVPEFGAEVSALLDKWVPAGHRGVLFTDGWYYLQKRDTAAGRDRFDPRAGPCIHNNWGSTHRAPQAHKGALDFFGESPASLERCNNCHCYRARL